jgi:hypothetical protein
VRYWKRWQFLLVWLGYVVLLAWDTLIASFVICIFVNGDALTWR